MSGKSSQRSITAFLRGNENNIAANRKSAASPSSVPPAEKKQRLEDTALPLTTTTCAPVETIETSSSAAAASSSISYGSLCDVFGGIEKTTKRLEITDLLMKYFITVIQTYPENLIKIVYLCLNKICPDYEGKELGIGESIIMKSIERATGSTLKDIKRDSHIKGDLGQDSKKSQKRIDSTFFSTNNQNKTPKVLSVELVFNTLYEIAHISGSKSQHDKINKIVKILGQCQNQEPKYFIRSLEGKLRIGLAERTVLAALARAFTHINIGKRKCSSELLIKELAAGDAILKQVFSELPSYDLIIPALLEYGIQNLPDHCRLTPGIPLKPMLAHPTKSLTEVLNRFDGMTFTCEYKYDGERAQIHLFSTNDEQDKIMVFSRNSENLSMKYPDIPIQMKTVPNSTVQSYVLDCEAVAWDVAKSCILPFQVLQTRKRKDVATKDVQVSVCIFAFDLLYLNGVALTAMPLAERKKLLIDNFQEQRGVFELAKSMNSKSIDDIQNFLEESVKGSCEGLMVKTLDIDATYEPSKRSRNWLKVKKDYLDGCGDTLDLVVIGAYHGRGKRTGVYGGYLLACYDEDSEEYQSICKIGTGFSDEDLTSLHALFKQHIMKSPLPSFSFSDTPNIAPDVWFDAKIVFEVKAADFSLSPVHKAAIGLVDPGRGISLRFPRFIGVRADKAAVDATGAAQVRDMYKAQMLNVATASKEGNADDDFDF